MKIVAQNTVQFLERFGAFRKALNPGVNFYIPFIETVSPPISMMEQIVPISHQKVITKDNVEIDVNGFFFYKVIDPLKAYYSVQNYGSAISGLSTSVSRSEIGNKTLDEIFQNREELNNHIKKTLNESATEWGLECLNYEMLKIEPPSTIRQSLLDVASAERTRRKEVILSEAEKEFQERVSIAKRDAEIIAQTAEWEGICIVNDEFKKALNELEIALKDCTQKDRIIQFVLIEEYIAKIKQILKSKNVFIVPENKGKESSDGLMILSTFLSQMNQLKGSNINIDELVQKLKPSVMSLLDVTKIENDIKAKIKETLDINTQDKEPIENNLDFNRQIQESQNQISSLN